MDKSPEIDRYDFSDESTSGLLTQVPATLPPGLIMRRCIPHEDIEAMEDEADYLLFEEMFEEERVYMKEPESRQDMDESRIRRYRKFIERTRPHWVGRIKSAMRLFNVDEEIVGFAGLPPYAGIAIIENLKERGEVPDEE